MNIFIKTIINYIILVVLIVAFVAAAGVVSYNNDLGAEDTESKILMFGLCAGILILLVHRLVGVLSNDKARWIVYYACFFGMTFTSLGISNATHEILHPTVEVQDLKDAMKSDGTFFHVRSVEIVDSIYGVYTKPVYSNDQHEYTRYQYRAAISHRIMGTKNAFWCYTLNSEEVWSYDDPDLKNFMATLDEQIQDYGVPFGEGYFKKISPKYLNDNFREACLKLDSTVKEPVVFLKMDESPTENTESNLSFTICFLIFIIVFIGGVFWLAEKKE